MEKFTASNGVEVSITPAGSARADGIGFPVDLTVKTTVALREFFQHERDQELGRWRERPSCTTVVYPNGADDLGNRCVIVLYEPTAGVTAVYENNIPGNLYGDAARNYFAAHPEPKPLPSEPHTAWVDKYGTDIWWVDGLGKLRCCASPGSDPRKYAPFTRLVPEVSDD